MNAGTNTLYQPTRTERWLRALGIRPGEARTVGLFFAHNFLLGIGTILIYVSANAILLENNPESSLPLAYVTAAVAMMLTGRLYAYYEHHLLLRNLAVRVLLAVVVMTALVGFLVVVGHSVAAAVAIMVGYRIIYLLTNLEFWGVSAVVFDTRQSKRLFGVISSGDMPAKALGAFLAALVHAHADVLRLLLVAFGAFGAALYVLRLTIQSHDVKTVHRPVRPARRETSDLINKRFGGSGLIFYMCLSLATLAAVATEIEYSFFINVKHRFHDQGEVIRYVSYVLALTYGIAMIVKLIVSRQVLDRFGVQRSLLVLPWVALIGLAGLAIVSRVTSGDTALLLYFCGLYLIFEVARRALFDPVFLVLFQPLSPPQRLTGHTLAKGSYEPLGLGIAGLMIFGLRANPTLETWVPLVWAVMLGGAVYLLRQTYRLYLHELNDAIGRRFLERDQLVLPTVAQKGMVEQLHSSDPAVVLSAIGWLATQKPQELASHLPQLLQHADATVRRRALSVAVNQHQAVPAPAVRHVALTDADPSLRELAGYALGRRISANPAELAPLLNHTDVAVRQGAIRGVLELNPQDAPARRSLTELVNDADPTRQQIALSLIATLRLTDFVGYVNQRLSSGTSDVKKAALITASHLPDPALTDYVVGRLTDKELGRVAVKALKARGADILSRLHDTLRTTDDRLLTERIATILGTIQTPGSRRLLNELVDQPDLVVRAAALRALRRFANVPADDSQFARVLREEIALAQRLLHGSLDEPDLTATLDYELQTLLQRLFDVLAQLYDSETIAGARLGVGHPTRERRANALEMLDNLIPRAVYQTMQVLIDDLPRSEKVRLMDAELGGFDNTESIRAFVLRNGETLFSAWTVSVVLRNLPTADRRAAEQALSSRFPPVSSLLMSHSADPSAQISEYDRVLLLANTSLFRETPENVLASITPIMKEEAYSEEDVIFEKGDLGTALYVIDAGEVLIRNGEVELARFGRGDFFGELALLDTEARSATAEALTDVRLLRLDQDDFYDLMEERGEVLRSIIRSLSGRIRRQNELLAGQPVPSPDVAK